MAKDKSKGKDKDKPTDAEAEDQTAVEGQGEGGEEGGKKKLPLKLILIAAAGALFFATRGGRRANLSRGGESGAAPRQWLQTLPGRFRRPAAVNFLFY